MRETPKELQIYRHFKGSLYQIVAVAVHTETTDRLVVYRSLTNPERVFARPLDMFLSEVNHKKYPDVKAKYRFTLLEDMEEDNPNENIEDDAPTSSEIKEDSDSKIVNVISGVVSATKNVIESAKETISEKISVNETEEINEDVADEKPADSADVNVSEDDLADEEAPVDEIPIIDPIVEKILDAKDYKDKIENLELIRGRITDEMLTTIAISLDIQFAGDTLEEKYADILKCLKMRNKYETNRFR